ncbi:hypothetical protein PG996_007336 [Apiospora saccharicola]|uniref:Uncharacterized protein n=1 Tax=Apiospora saccharicola TaxID=335842 RepID=A0ABR1VDZ1_9PEZI
MASFPGFIFNAASIASLGLMASDISAAGKGKEDSTHVEILIGTGTEQMGGHWPSAALWNEEGQRIGQGKAAYVLLSNVDNDAICVSAIYITETKTTTTWFGDVGKPCGMSWYQSNRRVGESGQMPACVWLDNDGSEGINSQALSFHIPDMIANDDRVAQFGEDIDSLCKSTPRFSFWGDLEADSLIPFFDPPLEYVTDAKSGGIGRDKDIERVKDKVQYDKSVAMYSGGNHKRAWHASRGEGYGNLTVPDFMLPRQKKGRRALAKKRSRRGFDNLIVTSDPGHSAKELCESATSYGADTVSMTERLFCDMEAVSAVVIGGGDDDDDDDLNESL